MTRAVWLAMWLLAAPAAGQQVEESYFSGRALQPTADEQALLDALAASRPRGGPSGKPMITADRAVRFTFGASLPIVVCAPLQVTDIELQAGERVRSVQVGDNVRWSVEPAVTGQAPLEIQHLIVKPADVGIRTSLVVTTDRRTYRMKLTSDRSQYMTSVSFAYPQDAQRRWAELATMDAKGKRSTPGSHARAGAQRPAGPRPSLQALSFNYELQGDDPPWKPVRVYNDGLQTVIEMPFAMRQTEAPTLVVVRAEGGVFTDDEVVQVNFHVSGTKYIVDMIFDVADLIVGVGDGQQKVRIRRK